MLYRSLSLAALLTASPTLALTLAPSAVGRPVQQLRATTPARAARVVLQEEEPPAEEEVSEAFATAIATPPGWTPIEELWSPDKVADMRIEGGKTLKTFKMPAHAERVQYILQSPTGRPIKAKVELWIGPIRCVHEFIYDTMSGSPAGEIYPIRATLQFKKLEPVLKISANDEYEFPLLAGVFIPSPEESKKIGELTTDMFYTAPMKQAVQGGTDYHGKKLTGGAIETFQIPPEWDQVQIMVWSKDVGKKSFKTNIEVLQGPNNHKMHLNLRCGGSTQPYHAVIDTPGAGWMLRCNSKKFLEDGKFEIAVAPYGATGDYTASSDVVVGGFGR